MDDQPSGATELFLSYGAADGEVQQIRVDVAADGTFSTEQDRRRYFLGAAFLDCGGGLDVDARRGDAVDLVLRCSDTGP